MKTYNSFMEEISPRRLKELEAKGKGAQARAVMANDKLNSGPSKPKPKSNALAVRPKAAAGGGMKNQLVKYGADFAKQQAGRYAKKKMDDFVNKKPNQKQIQPGKEDAGKKWPFGKSRGTAYPASLRDKKEKPFKLRSPFKGRNELGANNNMGGGERLEGGKYNRAFGR